MLEQGGDPRLDCRQIRAHDWHRLRTKVENRNHFPHDHSPSIRTAFGTLLMALFFSLPAAAVEAPFTYTTASGAITITGYIGPGGALTIPSTIDNLPGGESDSDWCEHFGNRNSRVQRASNVW